jgi:O-antigen ligase
MGAEAERPRVAEEGRQGRGLRPRSLPEKSTVGTGLTRGGTIATWLLIFYMWLDLVRPSFVWHFPKLLSTALFVTWLVQPDKRIPRQNLLMLLFLGVMVIDIPIAANSFAAVWTSYGMAVLLLGLCLPLVQFINSLARFRIVMQSLMAIFVVIGAWASVHNGYGPAAADGGQDENYVTACMTMGLPLLLYSSLSAETKLKKVLYLVPIPILLLAVVVAENPSRGGFIGFVCTVAYMVYYSKKRVMALIGVGVLAAIVGLMAGATFWNEIGTTADTEAGTAAHRKDLWRIATYMFMSYPLTGLGPNNYRWRIEEFETAEIIEKYGHSLGGTAFTHSLYFELLAELGSAGVILFALIVVRNFRDLSEIKRRVQQTMEVVASTVTNSGAITSPQTSTGTLKLLHCYAQGIAASLIAFLVCSAFISTLYYSYFWLYSALIASFKLIVDKILPQPAEGADVGGSNRP